MSKYKIQHNHTDAYIDSIDKDKIKNSVIIDLGCGDGYASKRFYELGVGKVYGIDHNLVEEDLLSKNHIEYLNDMSEVNGLVDVIWCHHVIEHVWNPIKFLSSIFNKLKWDGELLIGCPNAALDHPRIFSLGHIHNYHVVSLLAQLQIAGFNVHDCSWWWHKGQLRVRVKKTHGKVRGQNSNYHNYPPPILKQINETGRVNIDLLDPKYNW